MSKGEKKVVEKEVETNGVDLRKKFANVYSRYGTEKSIEEKGVVIDYDLPGGGIFSIKIKRAGARNAQWKKIYNEVMKPHAEDIEAGKLSEQENKVLLAEVWAKAVVVGWDNIKDFDGNDTPFSVENCYELFCLYPDLLNDVIADSHLRSNFQDEAMLSTAKNS